MTQSKKITPATTEVINEPKQSTSIVAQPTQAVNVESLISQGIEKGLSVDTMERLLAMRRELKAEFAKEAYDKAMAKFQSECPTIKKTKEVKTKSGDIAYRYAPLESIVEQVKVPLQQNGFSYSSNMELLENGITKVKASIKITHELGHNEVTDMTVPLGNKTQIMSDSQVIAAAQTFAKRYAFCNAFGILTGDEDNDGANLPTDMPREQISQNKFLGTDPQSNKPLYQKDLDEELKVNIQKSYKPTEKQAKFIKDLCTQKNIKQPELLAMAKGKNPKLLIDALLAHPTNPKEELPIIQQGQEMSPEDQALVDSVPF